MNRFHLALVLLALLAAPCLADIAPHPLAGGKNPVPRSGSTAVVMASEVVTLTLSEERAEVAASFRMVNPGPDTTLEVGFPMNYEAELRDFQARIDGRNANPRLDSVVREGGPPGRPRAIRTFWQVWEMSLKHGQECTVEVFYWTPPRKENALGRNNQLGWPESELAKRFQRRSAGYVLTTGAAWAGSIGKVEIIVRFAGPGLSASLRQAHPPGFERTGETLRWVFEDYDPPPTRNPRTLQWNPDILVTWCPGGSLKEETAAFETLFRSRPGDLGLLAHLADLGHLAGGAVAEKSQQRLLEAFFERPRHAGQLVFYDHFEPHALVDAALRLLDAPLRGPAKTRLLARCQELGDALDQGTALLRLYDHRRKEHIHRAFGKERAPKKTGALLERLEALAQGIKG